MESQMGDLMARMAVSVDSPAPSLERWIHKALDKHKHSQTGSHEVAAPVSAGDFTTSKVSFSPVELPLSSIPGGVNLPATAGDMRPGFDPWVWKIPWRRRVWQPTPVFLPGKSPWTGEPGGLHRVAKSRTQMKQRSTHTISQKSPEFKLHSNPILVLLVSFPSLPYSIQSV